MSPLKTVQQDEITMLTMGAQGCTAIVPNLVRCKMCNWGYYIHVILIL